MIWERVTCADKTPVHRNGDQKALLGDVIVVTYLSTLAAPVLGYFRLMQRLNGFSGFRTSTLGAAAIL